VPAISDEACGVEARNRFHGVTNREIRGNPDEVDGKKRKDDGGTIQTRTAQRSMTAGTSSRTVADFMASFHQ